MDYSRVDDAVELIRLEYLQMPGMALKRTSHGAYVRGDAGV